MVICPDPGVSHETFWPERGNTYLNGLLSGICHDPGLSHGNFLSKRGNTYFKGLLNDNLSLPWS